MRAAHSPLNASIYRGLCDRGPDSLFYRSRFVGGVFKESHSGGGGWLRGQGISEDRIAAYKARAVLDQGWKDTDLLFHRQNVEIPVYNAGGWHDIYAEGSLYNDLYLQNEGRDAGMQPAVNKNYL